MDDLDDLLDEIEDKFCRTNVKGEKSSRDSVENRRNSSNSRNSGGREPGSSARKSHDRTDADSLLDDIDASTPKVCDRLLPPLARSLSRTPTPNSTKCYPVYMNGSDTATGQGNSLNQLPCDQLRCTDCDFRIVMFDDYQWTKSVDYLFLRNNVPDFQKLSAKLKQKKGSRAYACQCCWRSVTTLVDLQSDRDLKWVCAGRH